MLLEHLKNKISKGKKAFALLIDPDNYDQLEFSKLINQLAPQKPDVILVGGSLLFSSIQDTITSLKQHTDIPIFIFPGSSIQVCEQADGILFTSLISGRNPDFLINQQVIAAPSIKQFQLETLSTGYILIESDNNTSVRYMSNTTPIPREKTNIALATAIAGEMLGLQAIYLEAGSGAKLSVPAQTISEIKQNTSTPLIVGGGIRSAEKISEIYKAGADMIVIGNAFENKELHIDSLKEVLSKYL